MRTTYEEREKIYTRFIHVLSKCAQWETIDCKDYAKLRLKEQLWRCRQQQLGDEFKCRTDDMRWC
ncbi:unnamed protein product [Phytomonas sp. EM1]|nr:unnamed protein product [Phytomonas sp. EM1]|eukprot:CCW65427.1 unnamed protein product [Phytomonas sp. isolate EM1]